MLNNYFNKIDDVSIGEFEYLRDFLKKKNITNVRYVDDDNFPILAFKYSGYDVSISKDVNIFSNKGNSSTFVVKSKDKNYLAHPLGKDIKFFIDLINKLSSENNILSVHVDIADKTVKRDNIKEINAIINNFLYKLLLDDKLRSKEHDVSYFLNTHNMFDHILEISPSKAVDNLSLRVTGKEVYDLSHVIAKVKDCGKDYRTVSYSRHMDSETVGRVEIDNKDERVTISNFRLNGYDNTNMYKFAYTKNHVNMINYLIKLKDEYKKRNLPVDNLKVDTSGDKHNTFIANVTRTVNNEEESIFTIENTVSGEDVFMELYEYPGLNPFDYVVFDLDKVKRGNGDIFITGYSNDNNFLFKLLNKYGEIYNDGVNLRIEYEKHEDSKDKAIVDLLQEYIQIDSPNDKSPITKEHGYFDRLVEELLKKFEHKFHDKQLVLDGTNRGISNVVARFTYNKIKKQFELKDIKRPNIISMIMKNNEMKYFDKGEIIQSVVERIC